MGKRVIDRVDLVALSQAIDPVVVVLNRAIGREAEALSLGIDLAVGAVRSRVIGREAEALSPGIDLAVAVARSRAIDPAVGVVHNRAIDPVAAEALSPGTDLVAVALSRAIGRQAAISVREAEDLQVAGVLAEEDRRVAGAAAAVRDPDHSSSRIRAADSAAIATATSPK